MKFAGQPVARRVWTRIEDMEAAARACVVVLEDDAVVARGQGDRDGDGFGDALAASRCIHRDDRRTVDEELGLVIHRSAESVRAGIVDFEQPLGNRNAVDEGARRHSDGPVLIHCIAQTRLGELTGHANAGSYR